MNPVADLSVVMPTFNHARYLRRALDAILSQSVRPKELIVVDDCSTDDTPAILAEYAQRDSLVRVYRNESNRGVNATVHRGLDLANGTFVYFCASDDEILPDFIAKSMDLLQRNPEAGLCSSYHSTRDGLTGVVSENPSQWCDQPHYFSPTAVEDILANGAIAGHTAIYRRSAVLAAGGYLPDLEWHSDMFLSKVVAFRHGMCHVPEKLALLTVMPGTYSDGSGRKAEQTRVLNALIDRLLSPAYADVAPAFRRSGCLGFIGLPLIRSTATRSDVWSPNVLALINCLTFAQYEDLKTDTDPAVRQLANLFLGPFKQEAKRGWIHEVERRDTRIKQLEVQTAEQHKVVMELCERIQVLDSTIEMAQDQIRRMQSSIFWKMRTMLTRCKSAIVGLIRPSKR